MNFYVKNLKLFSKKLLQFAKIYVIISDVWTRTLAHPLRCRCLLFQYFIKEGMALANIKSAKKRIKVIQAKTLQNKMFKTQLKTEIKKYEAALAAGDVELAQATYKAATKKIDQAASRGIIHKNAAAHKKSQFTLILNKMA